MVEEDAKNIEFKWSSHTSLLTEFRTNYISTNTSPQIGYTEIVARDLQTGFVKKRARTKKYFVVYIDGKKTVFRNIKSLIEKCHIVFI